MTSCSIATGTPTDLDRWEPGGPFESIEPVGPEPDGPEDLARYLIDPELAEWLAYGPVD